MGVDIHNLNLLAVAQDRGVCFRRTLAIGRQGVHVEPRLLEAHRVRRGLPPLAELQWFEPLLQQWYGAEEAHSVDASPYEQATRLHDMNRPWPRPDPALGHYDAVLDFGCLEHVFDFPTAWRNLVALTRPGGHILHALPCNNLAGHGFYQFSPELFFSLYRPERGFRLEGVWAAIHHEHRHWWAVADPMAQRRRVNLAGGHEVYLLVLAQKLDDRPQPHPQQSDYAQGDWQGQPAAPTVQRGPHPATGALRALGLLDAARRAAWRWRALRGVALDLPAPDFTRVDVAALTTSRR